MPLPPVCGGKETEANALASQALSTATFCLSVVSADSPQGADLAVGKTPELSTCSQTAGEQALRGVVCVFGERGTSGGGDGELYWVHCPDKLQATV